jgi:hypothetical protein
MTAELTRRDFFTRAGKLVVLLPIGASLIAGTGCTDSANADCATADTVMATSTAIVVTSTCAGAGKGHDHDFTVQDTDLATPPAAGVSGNSSPYEDDQHVHTVAITQAQLQSIQAGQTVSVISGSTLQHTHTFNFRKA